MVIIRAHTQREKILKMKHFIKFLQKKTPIIHLLFVCFWLFVCFFVFFGLQQESIRTVVWN